MENQLMKRAKKSITDQHIYKYNPVEKLYIDMLPYAVKFLSETFEISQTPKIIINHNVSSFLARLVQSISEDENGNQFANYKIEVSERLYYNYTFKEQFDIVKYELIRYAYSVQGLILNDRTFEQQVKSLGLPQPSEIELRGDIHVYHTACHSHQPIEIHAISKFTKQESYCPICKDLHNEMNPLIFTGMQFISNKEN